MSAGARSGQRGQILLVDADDTLWENQAWFDRALVQFDTICLELRVDPRRARDTLREEERVRVAREGYGSRRFARSLKATLTLLGHNPDQALSERLDAVGEEVFHHPTTPFPGVAETLSALAERHRLILVTKGDPEEQEGKVARSGLGGLFEQVIVLADKTPAHYEQLVKRNRLDASVTWMIGNSPRSDINPAREAGLKTIYVPHHSLWEHEAEPFVVPPTHTLARFADLLTVL